MNASQDDAAKDSVGPSRCLESRTHTLERPNATSTQSLVTLFVLLRQRRPAESRTGPHHPSHKGPSGLDRRCPHRDPPRAPADHRGYAPKHSRGGGSRSQNTRQRPLFGTRSTGETLAAACRKADDDQVTGSISHSENSDHNSHRGCHLYQSCTHRTEHDDRNNDDAKDQRPHRSSGLARAFTFNVRSTHGTYPSRIEELRATGPASRPHDQGRSLVRFLVPRQVWHLSHGRQTGAASDETGEGTRVTGRRWRTVHPTYRTLTYCWRSNRIADATFDISLHLHPRIAFPNSPANDVERVAVRCRELASPTSRPAATEARALGRRGRKARLGWRTVGGPP